jgi:putative ABC transport system permease protein
LPEFATLRALGASAGYIHKVILIQALLSAVVGYGVGMILTMVIIWATQETTLTIVMTPGLALLLFVLTLGMCGIAALSAIFKVTRIDPAGVFSR